MDDAKMKLTSEHVSALRQLANVANEIGSIDWKDYFFGRHGKGNVLMGGMGKRPLYSFFSDGSLDLWLGSTSSENKLARQVRQHLAQSISKLALEGENHPGGRIWLNVDDWIPFLPQLVESFRSALAPLQP